MNALDKKKFINSQMNSCKESIIANIPKMPENWDGFELKQYIADYINQQVPYIKMSRKRMSEYRNTVIVNNL